MASDIESPERQLTFLDTTLRDGEQAPGNTMSQTEKVAIAEQLVRMGIPAIEAGFPASSDEDFRSVQAIAEKVGSQKLPNPMKNSEYPRITGLARLNKGDITKTIQSVRSAPNPGVHTFISTSEQQLVKFENMIRARGGDPKNIRDFVDKLAVPEIEKLLPYIRKELPHAVIQFSPEDWVRTDDKSVGNEIILAAARNGADIINLPDTVGVGIPRLIGQRVRKVRDLLDSNGFSNVAIAWHGHNDTGQAVACAMEALYGGAEQFETTILGIGERAGNISFESLLAAIDANISKHEEIIGMKITDSLVRLEVCNTAALVAGILDREIPKEHPIVGKNVFAHESGIHADGVIKSKKAGQKNAYEGLDPERYGAKSTIVHGQHSGWSNLTHFIENEGLPFRNEEKDIFLNYFKIAAAGRSKGLDDTEVRELVYYPAIEAITEGEYIVDAREVESVNNCKAVELITKDGKRFTGVASSPEEGVIDAVVHAMKQIIPNVTIPRNGFVTRTTGEGSEAKAKSRFTMANTHTVSRAVEDADTHRAELRALLAAFNTLYAIEHYTQIIAKA